MDRMLYIGMSGAKEVMLSQGINNNNLANVSTPAFREDLAQQRSMSVFGPGHASRAYAMSEKVGVNYSPGALDTTGRELDFAIKQDGWFSVEAKDGNEAYTRAGSLRVTPQGLLQTSTGLPVLGNAGPIQIPPYESLSIGVDGTISIRPLGQGAAALAVVDRIRLVNPELEGMEKGRDGLFRLKSGDAAPLDAEVRIMPGMVERSNVSIVETMVKMIQLTRNFDMQTKIMKTAEEVDQASDTLMRVS